MLFVFSASAGELGEAIENWMIDNKINPSTPEEWERCITDLVAAGILKPVGAGSNDDADAVKKILKDNFDVEER